MAAEEGPRQAREALDSVSSTTEVPGTDDSGSGILRVDEVNMARTARIVKALPVEILDNIMCQLDTPAPSDSKLYDEPTVNLTSSKITDLKSSSLVCQKWRRAAFRLLFKHMCLIIKDPITPKSLMRNEHFAMADFVRRNNLKGVIKSFALSIPNGGFSHHFETSFELKTNDFASFWTKVLEALDPSDIKIVCPPLILGALTGCEVSPNTRYERYGGPYHLLQLRRSLVASAQARQLGLPTPGTNEEPQQEHAPVHPSVLFESRPWTALLLNEGSFIQAYKFEDFHQKEPPTILNDLIAVNWDGLHTAMIPATVRDFSYIAMFPPSNHFHKLTQYCPRLDRLYTQFVPRNDILDDEVAMKYIEANDLWLERNSCYAYIMRELFQNPPQGNYRYLKEFESGDAADVDAWEMAVEYVKRAGGGWRVEKPGVFVKDMELAAKQDKDTADPEFEEGQVPSLLSVPGDQQ
jgi:hypothetical protein